MQLEFEEKTLKYIDGVNIHVDLGVFIDEYMKSYRAKETKFDLGDKLGITHIQVAIIATKLEQIGVKLPALKIKV